MPLRFVRQAVANRRRSRLYYTHKASTHKRQANDSAIYKMKAQPFVCDASSVFDALVALRLEVPSLKKHIPLISALRMSVRSVKATPSAIINY